MDTENKTRSINEPAINNSGTLDTDYTQDKWRINFASINSPHILEQPAGALGTRLIL